MLFPPLLVVALALWGATGCKSGSEEAAAPAPKPRVRVQRLVAAPQQEVARLTGVVSAAPGKDVKLGALVAGRLARLLVVDGQPVHAGEVLAEIEAGPVADELEQARATAEEAAAAAQAAEAKRVRTDDLLRKGIAAEQEAEAARSEAVAAQSALARARAAVDLAGRKVGHASLRAPFDGVVASILVRQGEAVDGNGQPVLEVAALQPLEVRAPAAPNVAVRLRQDMKVRVRLPAVGLEREGRIVSVAPTADATSGNFLVRVVLDNKDGALKLGLLAEAEVPLRTWEQALAVPSPALVPGTDGGLAVVEVADGKAHTVPVRLAFEGGGHAVLESGVDAGTDVIIEGGYSLPDGSEVEVVP